MKKLFVGIVLVFAIFGYSFFIKRGSQTVSGLPNTSSSIQNVSGTPSSSTAASGYKDGTYIGDVTDAFYGNVQVQVQISGGKIIDIQFLQYPNQGGHTIEVSNQSLPQLKQEAIQAQNAQVDIVSGATQTSQAFVQSLQSALNKAKS